MPRAFGAFAAAVAMLLVFVAPVAACAPPPPGWVRDPVADIVPMFGPTLLAFGVPAFFAVRARSGLRRWIYVLAAICFAAVAFTFTVLLSPNCGNYLPPAT